MGSIQWRPEHNVLTVPPSWKIRFVPRDSVGTDELAAAMAAENPNYTADDAKTMLAVLRRVIEKQLLNGSQVTIDGMMSFGLSFTGRLESPDDPLPPADKSLHVSVRVLQPFLKEIKQQARFEKLAMTEKGPLIESVEDSRLHLADVLYSKGVLKLTGSNLLFDPEEEEGNECVLAGTRSGRAVQTQFGPISDSGIVIVPDIPAQDAPFNNEYTISVSTRPTGHGSPRIGTYRRRLRSVLVINGLSHEVGPGILSSSAADAPLVWLNGGAASANEMLRIQAVFDIRNGWLLLSLLGMKEDGQAGEAVSVKASGDYTLQGFAGSAVSSLTVNVADYAALLNLVRNQYYGRIVDVLDVRVGV